MKIRTYWRIWLCRTRRERRHHVRELLELSWNDWVERRRRPESSPAGATSRDDLPDADSSSRDSHWSPVLLPSSAANDVVLCVPSGKPSQVTG